MHHFVSIVPQDATVDDCSVDAIGFREQFSLLCLEYGHPTGAGLDVKDEVMKPANR